MWWQGEDKASELVRMCIAAMRKNSGNKEVIVLDQNNYKSYVEIPEYLIDKLSKGLFSFTHFSDILRMCVLYNRGGIWIDATVLLTNNLGDSICSEEYYTCKQPAKKIECISYGRWCGFLMGGSKGGILFDFANKFFFEYWKHEQYLIDYFLIDYVTELAYMHFEEFQIQYNSVPFNNPGIMELEKILNTKMNYDKLKKLNQDTLFFKLNWKKIYKKYLENGELTYYGYLSNKYLKR